MDSTRPIQTLFKPFSPADVPGVAAYSSENELAFLQKHTRAGIVAGVFLAGQKQERQIAPGGVLNRGILEQASQFGGCRIH